MNYVANECVLKRRFQNVCWHDYRQHFIIAKDFPRDGVRIVVEFCGIMYLF
jgi:hypothetical protein